MRFRSLETRIVAFFVLLLVGTQTVEFLFVSAANRNVARREVATQLEVGERVFARVLDQNGRQLAQAVALASGFAFREAIATHEMGTIVSVLRNHGRRIEASVAMLVDLNGSLIANRIFLVVVYQETSGSGAEDRSVVRPWNGTPTE